MSDHASTQELIGKIERKDKRFRFFQALFMVATFVALIFIIAAQQRTLDNVQTQVQKEAEVAEKAREQRTEQLAEITRRLDCMVVFFSQPNRDNLTIENVDNCVLNKNDDLNKFFQNDKNNSSENPPNLPNSAPTVTQENDEAQPQKEEEPTTVEPKPPVKLETPIIDIPLCVPFLDVCARQ